MLNIAYFMGFAKFLLVGYNLGAGGHTHFFGKHPSEIDKISPYNKFIQEFCNIQPEIRENIICCTQPTRLPADDIFVHMYLEDALEKYKNVNWEEVDDS